jgi:hypothetical protein
LRQGYRAPNASKRVAVRPSVGSIEYFVIFEARRRRCSISDEALELLAGHPIATSTERRRVFMRHRSWLRALAAVELAERRPTGTLRLERAHVAFQLACESTDLPDVLCL